jgi:hypothetical protein
VTATTTPSDGAPVLTVDSQPRLDRDKLVELLRESHEHEALDYKRELDLSDNAAVVELVKDIAAFSASGGYLVIGADDGGQPTAMVSEAEALLFDESRLRAKVKRYLPEPLTLRTARHDIDGALLVLVYIGPHPDGFVIVHADGQTGDNKIVFRRGDVFVRHGTASERWEPHDFGQIRQALINSYVGIPELVPAPPSTHRIEEPRLVHTGAGAQLYQRLFIEVENVGPAIARVGVTTANGYDPGILGGVRPPAAIAPNMSRPFELNARVADEHGLAGGAEIMLRVRYEGGGRERDLLTSVRYSGAAGFENKGFDIWEVG